jgi:recombination protein RecA
MFGSPVTTSGGHALKFTADVRVEISKTFLKEDDETFGSKVKVKITKNKMSPPFKKGEFVVRFGIGIDKKMEILDLAIEHEIIKKWGASITYNTSKYTLDEFNLALDDEDFRNELKAEITKKLQENGDKADQ